MKKMPFPFLARPNAVSRATLTLVLPMLLPAVAHAVDAAAAQKPGLAAPAHAVAAAPLATPTAAPAAAAPVSPAARTPAAFAAPSTAPAKPAAAGASASQTAATPSAAQAAPARGPKMAVPTVAIDVGRKPVAANGQPHAVGQAEFAFNQRFADQLALALLAQQVAVKRIPVGLPPAQRAKAAAGATLMVSVNHEVPAAAEASKAASHSGYTLAVSRQQAAEAAAALACARHVSAALLKTGRSHSLLHAPSTQATAPGQRPWADSVLGVQVQADLPVLKLAPVPALRLQVAVLANPGEARHSQDPAWTRAQASAVAKGVVACLKTPPNPL